MQTKEGIRLPYASCVLALSRRRKQFDALRLQIFETTWYFDGKSHGCQTENSRRTHVYERVVVFRRGIPRSRWESPNYLNSCFQSARLRRVLKTTREFHASVSRYRLIMRYFHILFSFHFLFANGSGRIVHFSR